RISISSVFLEAIDANGALQPPECPDTVSCTPIRAVARFRARAFGAAGAFFDVGGAVYLEGNKGHWAVGAATASDARSPFWKAAQFDVEGSRTGSEASLELHRDDPLEDPEPVKLTVPLASIRTGELFALHVSLEGEAIDDRGRESYTSAFIRDPQIAPGLRARGLEPRGAPRLKEPPARPRPAARCPRGPRPRGGTVQLSGRAFTVGEASGIPMVLVTRTGGSRGATSVTVRTGGGSARSGRDFKPTRTRVRFESGDTSPRLVEIPIREDLIVEPPEDLTVSLAHPRCARLGARRSAAVTILDDDQPPPPPPAAFTIGGTVDGLHGSGLVLSNLGAEVPVSANGSFAFPGTASDGQTYEVEVKTQPHSPDQVCTVEHGTGHVSGANVSDIAVHCAAIATPSGLDVTFGGGGRVSTALGGIGHGEAVVIQPNGGIVTAGSREIGIASDFALTRHDPDGTLDTSFGTNGIVTTDLGGVGDQAFDAAILSDGGIVAVGRTDAAGVQRTDFGMVRYKPDGSPNSAFGTSGIVTTDIRGQGDQANAVAVQPDGKILVAGFATSASGIDSDFALVRYNADGTLDQSFGTGGIVTTDLGTRSDDARALAIQPDGKIVLAGSAGEDIGLARYTPNGSLDPTFASSGRTITDLGFEDVANGVALTSAGGIVVAGYTIGAKLNNDFLLVRYGPDGDLDTGFGTLGVVKTDLGSGDDFAEDLTIDAAGRIVVVGRATSPTILDMALARYSSDGTLDPGFASNGILTADFHGAGDFGQDVALDGAGGIVAAGYTADGPDTEFALLRANP
ncbi:MAG TPA: Calx-beta domain-containing protein, partial [Gaiellales bacterium]|nr:Calx-beta domain-containing protein [Gaiellales bacterium]